jgi:hypothetical protein
MYVVRNTLCCFPLVLLLFLSDVSFHILINLYFLSWFLHQFIKHNYVNELPKIISKHFFFFLSFLFLCCSPAPPLLLPCYSPAPPLLLPSSSPATRLLLTCCSPAALLLLTCYSPAITLLLHCYSPAAPLLLPCCTSATPC